MKYRKLAKLLAGAGFQPRLGKGDHEVWNVVRREVDRDRTPGRFLLTGSASAPSDARIHSGAGRIVSLLMRPMTLPERGVCEPTVSFADLLTGTATIEGRCDLQLADYTREILSSGFPGIRDYPEQARRAQLDGYLARIVNHEIPEAGISVRKPRALMTWLTAYAAATATTASYSAILDAATPGESDKPSRTTTTVYREALQRLWVLDPLPAWIPAFNDLGRLAQSPKHHLVDPALAARLLGASERSLLRGDQSLSAEAGKTRLGSLFESLVALSVRVFAQNAGATVSHLRTRDGDHEVDLIVELDDKSIVAIEVKLGQSASVAETTHHEWLRGKIGDRLIETVIINTGPVAYRLPNGTAVIPLGLLGP
jgi:predicted AAA+ superfamily ATPase